MQIFFCQRGVSQAICPNKEQLALDPSVADADPPAKEGRLNAAPLFSDHGGPRCDRDRGAKVDPDRQNRMLQARAKLKKGR